MIFSNFTFIQNKKNSERLSKLFLMPSAKLGMIKMKNLVYAVDDDAAIRELYEYTLEKEFRFACFDCGEMFLEAVSERKPDIVLLDVMLPGEDGFAVLSRLKSNRTTANIPVIMVSAKSDEISKVKGLNFGAKDYISKPFGVLELVARIKANLRKNILHSKAENLSYKDIIIDSEKHIIHVNSQNIPTTLKEFLLLSLLCKNAEKVQSREKIFLEIWNGEFLGETRTLDTHINELRRKLAAAESAVSIKTIKGVGYILA